MHFNGRELTPTTWGQGRDSGWKQEQAGPGAAAAVKRLHVPQRVAQDALPPAPVLPSASRWGASGVLVGEETLGTGAASCGLLLGC